MQLALSPDGSTVYAGSNGDDSLYAFDAANGNKEWSFPLGSTVSGTPLKVSPDGSTVYCGSLDSGLFAVDAASGQEKWRLATFQGLFSPPALSPNGSVVYVNGDSGLFAIDAVSGHIKWTLPCGTSEGPTVSADGSTVYVGGDSVVAVDAASGQVKWSGLTAQQQLSSPALSPDGSTVYAASNTQNVQSILYAVWVGGIAWSTSRAMASFSPEL